MARTLITPWPITRNFASPVDESTQTATPSDVGNGNYIPNSGRTWFKVKNTGSTPRLVTVQLSGNNDGNSFTPKTVTVPAGAIYPFGFFPQDKYGGLILITGAHAELTINAFDFPA